MRGHWSSQTRKLNKHYQSINGNFWDPVNEFLMSLTKNGEKYYVAPSYGCIRDGSMVKNLEYPDTNTFISAGTPGITIYKAEDFVMTPYIPKSSDAFYILNAVPVSFVANNDFDLKTNDTEYEVICSYKSGQNLTEVEANFLSLTYDVYVTYKKGTARYTSEELRSIANEIKNTTKLDGSPNFKKEYEQNIQDIYGYFSAAISQPYGLYYMNNLTANRGVYGYDTARRIIQFPARTLQPQYFSNYYWNGEQKVTDMYSRPIFSRISAGSTMCGFNPGNSIESTQIFDLTGWIKPWFVLKEINTMKGSVTG